MENMAISSFWNLQFIALTIGEKLIFVILIIKQIPRILYMSLGQMYSSGSKKSLGKLDWGIRVTCVKRKAPKKTTWVRIDS